MPENESVGAPPGFGRQLCAPTATSNAASASTGTPIGYRVFPDRAAADEVMQEIGATPIVADGLAWPVLIWNEDARVAIGT